MISGYTVVFQLLGKLPGVNELLQAIVEFVLQSPLEVFLANNNVILANLGLNEYNYNNLDL